MTYEQMGPDGACVSAALTQDPPARGMYPVEGLRSLRLIQISCWLRGRNARVRLLQLTQYSRTSSSPPGAPPPPDTRGVSLAPPGAVFPAPGPHSEPPSPFRSLQPSGPLPALWQDSPKAARPQQDVQGR